MVLIDVYEGTFLPEYLFELAVLKLIARCCEEE